LQSRPGSGKVDPSAVHCTPPAISNMPPRHDVLFWDLGDVLIHVEPLRACRAVMGGDEAAAHRLLERLIHSPEQEAFELGEIAPEEFHRRLTAAGVVDLPYPAFRAAWVDIFTPIDESFRLLEAIHRQRPCWLLSNTDTLHFEYIERRWGVRRFLAGTVLSYEVGARKPQREIFHAAAERAGIDPDRAGFIDDVAEHVHGARLLGFDAVQFTGASDLRQWLHAAGYEVPDIAPAAQ
jgi:FMN phosphatase YigB (HAD superfamily)